MIADRRAHPRDDLVSILVHAEIDGERLSDNELLMESLLILIGGDETTRHVLSGGMYELLRHPEQLQALARDPSRIPAAVEEMLRWVSPIQNMARTAARDVELHGQRIEAGQKVLLLYPAANRDPAVFPRSAPLRRRGARRTTTSRSASARTSASAPTWRASSCACSSRSWCARMPDPGPRPTRTAAAPAVELHLRHRQPAGRVAPA